MAVTTRLEIFNADGSGLQTQPFDNNIPVNLTFNLADVREPDKRKASRSLTINIEASNEVNKCFENIFEVNIATQYFNKNKKTPVKYFVNEILNFEGSLQLIKIVIRPDKSINYECSIIGEGGSLFVEIGEKLIKGNTTSTEDLDFSAYNHTYDRTTQIASRTNAGTGLSYVYPFIDRGTNGGSDTVWNVRDFLPCFHVYEYVKKIIEKAGYTFTSTILNSAEFKKYIVYPNIDKIELSQSQLDNRQFYVGLSTDRNVTINGATFNPAYTDESSGNGFFDLGNQNHSSGTYAILNDNGYYNLASVDYYKIKFTHSDPNVVKCIMGISAYKRIRKNGLGGISTGWFIVNQSSTLYWSVQNTFGNSGDYLDINTDYYFSSSVATGEMLFGAGDYVEAQSFVNWVYTPVFYDSANNVITTGTATWTVKLISGAAKSSFYALSTKKEVIDGNSILANNCLPVKIKQKDFLKSIIQAFNLYVDLDPNDNTNLIIESFDGFYNTLPIKNFENKTDIDKEQTINPNLLEGKRYIYTYKDDTDYWNDRYKKTWNETFGTQQVDVDNDFVKSDKKNELIFSPTPNIANYNLGIAHPRIYKEEGQGGAIVRKSFAQNIRLLVCGGVKSTMLPYTYKQLGATDLVTTDYLYAGHTDDPFNPTIDLNFGLPKEVYYTYVNSYFTTNNLYNRFHAYYLKNLIDRDSRIETKYLWVNAKDINEFNFRNRIFVDGAYWIVNKIENYNPLSETSTKFELVKLLNADVFTPTSIPIFSNTAVSAGNNSFAQRLNNQLNIGQNIINNGSNCIAIGNDIFIPESCNNLIVSGSNIQAPENSTGLLLNYKKYVALITQTGTNNPTVTVLENTIGDIVWTRDNVGQYLGTLTGVFTLDKVVCFNNDTGTDSKIETFRKNSNIVSIYTFLADGTTFTDGLLTKTSIEIRIYN